MASGCNFVGILGLGDGVQFKTRRLPSYAKRRFTVDRKVPLLTRGFTTISQLVRCSHRVQMCTMTMLRYSCMLTAFVLCHFLKFASNIIRLGAAAVALGKSSFWRLRALW